MSGQGPFLSVLDAAVPISANLAGTVSNSWSEFVSPAALGQIVVVQGIDWTATQAEPVQCFTHLEYLGGHIFFWDSQSTGEGLGVRWSWRGSLLLRQGSGINVVGTTGGASIAWGGAWFGITIPGDPS